MRIKIFCGALLLLMLNVVFLYAQPGEPCLGTDPDAQCPLDTWVIVLAVGAFVFAAVHLHRKQIALNNRILTHSDKNDGLS